MSLGVLGRLERGERVDFEEAHRSFYFCEDTDLAIALVYECLWHLTHSIPVGNPLLCARARNIREASVCLRQRRPSFSVEQAVWLFRLSYLVQRHISLHVAFKTLKKTIRRRPMRWADMCEYDE